MIKQLDINIQKYIRDTYILRQFDIKIGKLEIQEDKNKRYKIKEKILKIKDKYIY